MLLFHMNTICYLLLIERDFPIRSRSQNLEKDKRNTLNMKCVRFYFLLISEEKTVSTCKAFKQIATY